MLRRPDIYVIEDDPILLGAIAALLEDEGYAVRAFQRATAALDAISAELPRLVVTDQQMPDLSGYELMRAARERMGERAPPFLLVTGADVPRDIVCAFDGVLYKPFRLDDLLEQARRLGVRVRTSGTRIRAGGEPDGGAASGG